MSTNPTTINAPEGTPFLDVIRDFDATPTQLFRAVTEPELVARWLGPRDLEIDIEEYDARPGGRYRPYTSSAPAPCGAFERRMRRGPSTTAGTSASSTRGSTACSTPWSRRS